MQQGQIHNSNSGTISGASKDLPRYIWEQLLRMLCMLCSAVLGPAQQLAASCPGWLSSHALEIGPADEPADTDEELLLGLCLGIHACFAFCF